MKTENSAKPGRAESKLTSLPPDLEALYKDILASAHRLAASPTQRPERAGQRTARPELLIFQPTAYSAQTHQHVPAFSLLESSAAQV